jgi:signal transduction histidine kinase/CheY-like chemotaxis protein
MLQGVIVTCVVTLVPSVAMMTWQWLEGVPGLSEGLCLGYISTLSLSALALWRGPERRRAALLIGTGYLFVMAAIFADGFSPAQYPAVCTLITISVLLYGLRVASYLLAASAAGMVAAAYLFHIGYLTPIDAVAIDVRNPINWIRVILFTVYPSATAAVATGYLVDKLRQTLNARSELVARLRDEVVQRERTLAELEATQTRLLQTQKLEAIGQLAAGIAHDFNNTLSVIAMEAELLKRRNTEPSSVALSADALLSAAERGSQLTRQLLLFNRADAARRPVIDVVKAFEECLQVLTRLLPSEITFQVEIATSPMHVCILPGELQQIVLNLGINARDAMPSGGELHLRLEPCELTADDAQRLGVGAGQYVKFSCRDTGAGMDSVTLSRVFEPFFTTKNLGRGSGLGLTTVWSIVQRVRGSIHVDSTPNAGTLLQVCLPLSAAVPVVAQLPVAPSGGTNETILVVEDDIRVRALLVTLLADAGYVVLEAQSADAASSLERAHKGPIDLVCTDVVMPGTPARELLAEIQQRRPAAGVLVCSGYSEDERIARGISSGEFVYLGKPFTRAALLAAVREALQTTRQTQDQQPSAARSADAL